MVVKMSSPGRKLEKPVCHYSLSWAKDEKPERPEMMRAAEESQKGAGRVSPGRSTARACDRKPGGPGERPGGGG